MMTRPERAREASLISGSPAGSYRSVAGKVQKGAPDILTLEHTKSAPHLRRQSLPDAVGFHHSLPSRPLSRGSVNGIAPEGRRGSVNGSALEGRSSQRLSNPDVRGIVSKRRKSTSASATDLRSLAVAPLLVEKHRHVPRPPPVLSSLSRRHSTTGTEQDWFTKAAYVHPPSPTKAQDDAGTTGTGPANWSELTDIFLAGDSPRELKRNSNSVTNDTGEDSTIEPSSSSSSDQSRGDAGASRSGKEPRGMDGSRTMEEFRDRHNGFSEAEVSRMQQAFMRFLPQDTSEVESGKLHDILIHLGYLGVTEEGVDKIAEEISGFSTWAFDEFQEVAEKVAANERQLLLDTFESHSNDKGKMNIQQLIDAMKELEVGPLKATVREILPSACGAYRGLDGVYMLDLDAFLNFIAAYRVREGFTNSELLKARQVFDEAARRSRAQGSPSRWISAKCDIKVSDLSQALLDMFGPFLSNEIRQQCNALPSESPEDNFRSPGRDKSQTLAFQEFMIWARRVRSVAISELWKQFEGGSGDDVGLITMSELGGIMCGLGFTLFRDALDEFIEESGLRKDERIDIDRFVTFVNTCRRHGGFSQKDLDEFAVVFAKFDYDKSGEIDKLEFLDLLRYLGYTSTLEDVHRFMEEADANQNGGMDFSEFVRLMRLHRELELKFVQKTFEEYCDDRCETLSRERCHKPLNALTQAGRIEALRAEMLEEAMLGCPEAVHFEDFVALVDKCRRLCVTEKRQRAGFSDREFKRIRKCFESHVKPDSNALERGQFLWLVAEMGIDINSQEERGRIFSMLDDCRCAARDAGVEPHEVGELGSPSMTFWAIVHFLHLWRRKYESDKVTQEEEVIDETRFSRAEVAEFRELFMEWVGRSAQKRFNALASPDKGSPEGSKAGSVAKYASQPQSIIVSGIDTQSVSPKASGGRRRSMPDASCGRRRSMPDILNPEQNASDNTGSEAIGRVPSKSGGVDLDTNEAALPVRGLRQLLCSIGLELNSQQCTDLDEVIVKFLGRKESKINFVTFLRVMRWMLDTNFADINGAAQRSVEKGTDKVTKTIRVSPKARPSPTSITGIRMNSPSELSQQLEETVQIPQQQRRYSVA